MLGRLSQRGESAGGGPNKRASLATDGADRVSIATRRAEEHDDAAVLSINNGNGGFKQGR